ncbi:hypothetical protein TrVE_jg1573 [Triparma verrucosa]|uniref:Uncharacterized protein n=1 Tax=Triparma verrucosa TaxID=1606542 RepID=A0A9W7FMG2_9STRA|nr:hypothetical protein TrVE_jg1573 [Triparma verrucosa]
MVGGVKGKFKIERKIWEDFFTGLCRTWNLNQRLDLGSEELRRFCGVWIGFILPEQVDDGEEERVWRRCVRLWAGMEEIND